MAHRPADHNRTDQPNTTSRPQTLTAEPSAAPAVPYINCDVTFNPDGSAFAKIYIEPDILRRLKTRANGQAMERYLWETIFYRALCNEVY
jgi:hypothetical protein